MLFACRVLFLPISIIVLTLLCPISKTQENVPGTIQADFEQVTGLSSNLRRRNLQLARREQPPILDDVSQQLDPEWSPPLLLGYQLNLTIGTPPKKATVLLDTASTHLWVEALDTPLCIGNLTACQPWTEYSISKSSSVRRAATSNITIQYFKGEVNLSQYTDSLGMGDTTLPDFPVKIATNSSDLQAHGVMGIGNPNYVQKQNLSDPNATPVKGFLSSLKESGAINTTSYSLYFRSEVAGSIVFGGIDKAKFDGQLAAIDIKLTGPNAPFFAVDIMSVGILSKSNTSGDSNLNVSSVNYPANAIPYAFLDSGSSLTSLPAGILNPLYEHLGMKTFDINSPLETARINCAYRTANLTMLFTLGYANTTGRPSAGNEPREAIIEVPMADLIGEDEGGCEFFVQGQSGNTNAVIGANVMAFAYTVFDIDNGVIGIAPANAKVDPGTTNIVTIPPGGIVTMNGMVA